MLGEFRPPGPQARESLRGQPSPAASAGPTAHALPARPVRRPRTPGFPAMGLSPLPSPGEPGAPRAPSLLTRARCPLLGTPRPPCPPWGGGGRGSFRLFSSTRCHNSWVRTRREWRVPPAGGLAEEMQVREGHGGTSPQLALLLLLRGSGAGPTGDPQGPSRPCKWAARRASS